MIVEYIFQKLTAFYSFSKILIFVRRVSFKRGSIFTFIRIFNLFMNFGPKTWRKNISNSHNIKNYVTMAVMTVQ